MVVGEKRKEKSERSSRCSRVGLLVPRGFLRRFDEAIEGWFPSRSEAIRRGMTLVIREARVYRPDEEGKLEREVGKLVEPVPASETVEEVGVKGKGGELVG